MTTSVSDGASFINKKMCFRYRFGFGWILKYFRSGKNQKIILQQLAKLMAEDVEYTEVLIATSHFQASLRKREHKLSYGRAISKWKVDRRAKDD